MSELAPAATTLSRYRELLLAWNVRVNLIGPEAVAHIDAHIGEAVAAAHHLQPLGNVLDFGSGGGLPGIPMAIVAPQARFHLVEADQKKWAFLKHVVRECELNSVVYGDRLAAVLPRLPPDLRFSLIISRAVGNPEAWVPMAGERLTSDGRVALFQGTTDLPTSIGAASIEVFPLPRGDSNYLVTFTVPRGT